MRLQELQSVAQCPITSGYLTIYGPYQVVCKGELAQRLVTLGQLYTVWPNWHRKGIFTTEGICRCPQPYQLYAVQINFPVFRSSPPILPAIHRAYPPIDRYVYSAHKPPPTDTLFAIRTAMMQSGTYGEAHDRTCAYPSLTGPCTPSA